MKFELKRKFFHIFSIVYVLIYAFFAYNYGHAAGLMSLVALLIAFLTMEFFRLQLKKKIPLFQSLWRKREDNKLGGEIFLLIGAIIVLAVFSFKIALVALLMVVFGDMAAALFGITLGKNKIKGLREKAWEGAIAELIVDFIIAFILLESIPIALGMALAATFVETVFNHVDDNLTIPITAAFVGEMLTLLLV